MFLTIYLISNYFLALFTLLLNVRSPTRQKESKKKSVKVFEKFKSLEKSDLKKYYKLLNNINQIFFFFHFYYTKNTKSSEKCNCCFKKKNYNKKAQLFNGYCYSKFKFPETLSSSEIVSKSKLVFPKLTEHYEFQASRRKKFPSLQYYLKQRIFENARTLKGGTREEQLIHLGLGKQFVYSTFLL